MLLTPSCEYAQLVKDQQLLSVFSVESVFTHDNCLMKWYKWRCCILFVVISVAIAAQE